MPEEEETTAERAERLRREGVRMCGPLPPSEEDLEVVERFRDYLRAKGKAGN